MDTLSAYFVRIVLTCNIAFSVTCSSLAKKRGFSVCRYFCGHGIGSEFHGKPEIRHDGKLGSFVLVFVFWVFFFLQESYMYSGHKYEDQITCKIGNITL